MSRGQGPSTLSAAPMNGLAWAYTEVRRTE